MKIILLTFLFTTSLFAQNKTLEISPIADTYVTNEASEQNFGTSDTLDLKTYFAGTRLLIKFDENEIKSLLQEHDLVSARLELPLKLHWVKQPGTIGLHKMKEAWTESGATWNCPIENCTNSWLMWSHDPNNTIPYPYEMSPLSVGEIGAAQEMPVSFDMTGYVSDLLESNTPDFGFAVFKTSTNINDPVSFHSRESDLGPKIILTVKDKVTAPQTLSAKLTLNQAEGVTPLSIHFDASSSVAGLGNEIVKYELELGNGTKITLDKNSPVHDFTYTDEGDYLAILTVTDSEDNTSKTAMNIAAIGIEGAQLDTNYGYRIHINEGMNVSIASGEKAQIQGDICKIWKTQDKNANCHWVDSQKLHIRAFFPDMTSEVSGLVSTQTVNNRRNFSYETPEMSIQDLNTFTLMVGEIDPDSMNLLALTSKLELRVNLLNQKIVELRADEVELAVIQVLEKTRNDLLSLISKIESRNAKIPSVLAQYNLPLKVDNKVSANRYYSTMVGGFRFEFLSEIGNLIEGDFAKVKTKITNINYVTDMQQDHEGYIAKLKYKNAPFLTRNLSSLSKNQSFEYTLEDSFGANPSDLHSIDIDLEEKFKWWQRKVAGSDFFIPVLADNVAPHFENKKSEIQYAKNFPRVLEIARDGFGKLRPSTFKALISGQKEGDVTSFFSLETKDRGASYQITGNLPNDYNEQGDYELTLSIEDFSGKKTEDYTISYKIDRTKPIIELGKSGPILTNDPSFTLPVLVLDHSPATIIAFHNGVEVERSENKDTSFNFSLIEGNNSFEMRAVDAAGNEADVKILSNVVLDTIPPELIASNPTEGDVLRRLQFTFNGQTNEPLSSVVINDSIEATLLGDKTTFSADMDEIVQGPHTVHITTTDLAGNTSTHTVNYQIILKLIRTELISVIPDLERNKMRIIGTPGAIVPNIEIDLRGGFFNSTKAMVQSNGSFVAELDFFTTATIEAYYAPVDKYESESISSNADSALSGIVKDALDDSPLGGVKVTIQENGKTAVTDEMGVFSISSPGLGNATLIVDGTTIPTIESRLNEDGRPIRLYATQVVKLVLSNTFKNVIEKPIYFSPLLMDGSETEVTADAEVVVTSIHAPGVELRVPAGAANFPSAGTDPETGEPVRQHINVAKVESSKTTYNPPESIKPDFVYSFEPSGLSFNQRVKLTLPNENEFVVGQKLAIMSKNSATGNWELDGTATVTSSGSIETDPESGITHFSDIYAVPYSPDITAFNSQKDKPQLTTSGNAVSTTIALPSFKKFGQDITPSLSYKSTWANPRALVSQVFNLERYHYHQNINETQKTNLVRVETDGFYKYWTEPDWIKSKFYVDNKESDEITFNIKNAPENAVVSYAMNLDDVPTGIYRARSEYKVRFKHFEQTYLRSRAYLRATGSKVGTEIIDDGPKELKDIENDGIIIPAPLDDVIYQQNYATSEFGRGWKLGFTQRVFQPKDDRMMVEEESGAVSPYIINNTVENLHYDEKGILAMNAKNFPEITYSTEDGRLVTVDALSANVLSEKVTANHEFGVGINYAWRHGGDRRKRGSCFNGCSYDHIHYYQCVRQTANYSLPKRIFSIHNMGGKDFYLDHRGAVYSFDSEEQFLAGKLVRPDSYNVYQNNQPSAKSHCEKYTQGQKECENYSPNFVWNTNSGWVGPSHWPPVAGHCNGNPVQNGSGLVPARSSDQIFTANESSFNDPRDMTPSRFHGGVMYVADTFNNRVKKVNTTTNSVEVIAGNGTTDDNVAANHTPGRLAKDTPIYRPNGVLEDSQGNLYISSERGYIRKVTPDGKIYTIAGRDQSPTVSINDTLQKVRLVRPAGMAIDERYNFLYVADSGNNRVVALELDENRAVQIAGRGEAQCSPSQVAGKAALETDICAVSKIALDNDGNLLVVDQNAKLIRRVILQQPTSGTFRFKSLADDGSQMIRYNDGSLQRLYRNGASIFYAANGLQLRAIDKNEKETAFIYNGDLLTRVDFPDSTSMTLSYAGNLLSEITDPSGRSTYFDYASGKLTRVTFPDNTQKTFSYRVEDGALIEENDQRGFATRYAYNKWDFLEKVIRPDGSIVQLSSGISDTVGNDFTDGNVAEVESTTNEQGDNEFKDVLVNANNVETEIFQDMSGFANKIVQKTDSGDKITLIENDAKGRVVKITRPNLTYVEFIYSDHESLNLPLCKNLSGDLTNTTCVNPEVSDLISKYDSETGLSENFEYNIFGDLLYKSVVKNGTIIDYGRFYYDVKGNLIRQVDANGNSVEKTYDLNTGLLLSDKVSVNSENYVTSYVHDDNGNLVERVLPNGETSSFVRDFAGNVTARTNAKNIQTLYTYNSFNKLTSVSTGVNSNDPVGKMTSYEYDEIGNLTRIIDPYNNRTLFEYNSRNLLSKKTSPLGQVTELAYDGEGNVTWEKDPNGAIKTYTYNSENLITAKNLPDNLYQMSYDSNGNLTTVSDNDSSLSFSYEKINDDYQVVESIASYDGMNDFTVSYGFNAKGLRNEMSFNHGQVLYNYDNGGRLTGLSNHLGENFSFSYDEANRLTSITRPGSVSAFTYDKNSFVTSILHKKTSGSTINNFAYTRDAVGNRTSIVNSRGIASYSYDVESQLVGASNSEITGDYASESFEYDHLGNRLLDQLGHFNYDNKSQRLTSDYKYNYIYDNNGNLVQKSEKGLNGNFINYTYSSENQLVKIEEFKENILQVSSSYFYDAIGRRFKKEIVNHQDSLKSFTRGYQYDGQEILAEYDGDSSLLAIYTHSGLRTDDVLAVDVRSSKLTSQTGSYFYLKDALGSVTDVANSSGESIQSYQYSSFGKLLSIRDKDSNVITENPILKTSFTYTNREYDEESGMYYYRARYYEPSIGRFLQEDPHPGVIENPLTSINKFSYVKNNPLKYIDPNGEFGIIAGILIASVIGGTLNMAISGKWDFDTFWSGFKGAAIAATVVVAGAYLGAFIATGASFSAAAAGGSVASFIGATAGGAIAGGYWGWKTTGTFEGAVLGAVGGAFTGAALGSFGFGLGLPKNKYENMLNGVNDFNRGATTNIVPQKCYVVPGSEGFSWKCD